MPVVGAGAEVVAQSAGEVGGQVGATGAEALEGRAGDTPVPIAWATPSSRTRRNAERSIPEGDWQLLRENLDRVADVRATKYDLLEL